jgi:hypothetical protein
MEFPKHGSYTASSDGLGAASTQAAAFGMIMCLTVGHAFVICNVKQIGILAIDSARPGVCCSHRKMIRHRTAVDNPVEKKKENREC